MSHCENCGKELKDGATFCASCGHKVGDPLPSEEFPTPSPEASPQVAAKPKSTNAVVTKFNAMPKKKRAGIIGGAAAVVVAIIALIVFFVISANNVPTDLVKQDFAASSAGTKGIVSSQYVNESPYEITEFKIDEQHEESGSLFGMTITGRVITFSGTMKNENFETTFIGNAAYTKENNKWTALSGPSIDSSQTTPLKGVSSMNYASNTSSAQEGFTTSDFQSSLDQADNGYTSTASQMVKYENWFADDTAKNSQLFTFDNESGWKPSGNVEVSDIKTDWKLADKTFDLTADSSVFSSWSGAGGTASSSVTFKQADGDTLSAEYSFDFTPSSKDTSRYAYHGVSLAGTLTGTAKHEIGSSNFTVEMNDADAQATLSLKSSTSQTVAGSGTVNTLYSSIKTNSLYKEDLSNSSYNTVFKFDSLYYTEVV